MAGAADDKHTRCVWTDEERMTTPGIQPAFSQQHHPAGLRRGIRAKNQGQLSSGGHKPLEDIWISDPLHIQTLYSIVNRFDYCHQRSVEICFSLFYFQPDIPESIFSSVSLFVLMSQAADFCFHLLEMPPNWQSSNIMGKTRTWRRSHGMEPCYSVHHLTVCVLCVCV